MFNLINRNSNDNLYNWYNIDIVFIFAEHGRHWKLHIGGTQLGDQTRWADYIWQWHILVPYVYMFMYTYTNIFIVDVMKLHLDDIFCSFLHLFQEL